MDIKTYSLYNIFIIHRIRSSVTHHHTTGNHGSLHILGCINGLDGKVPQSQQMSCSLQEQNHTKMT